MQTPSTGRTSPKGVAARLAGGLAFVLAACLASAQPPAPHVVLISIDGLVPEVITGGPRVPALMALRDSGSYADGVVGVYPSLTYPSHTTLVTGARPARHGIMSNTAFDPEHASARWRGETREIRVRTLWEAARARGLKTAALSWPVSVGADVDYLIPEGPPAPNQAGLVEVARRVSTPGLVDEVLAVTGGDSPDGSGDMAGRDRFFAAAAAHVIRTRRPDLLLLHLVQADEAQHSHGRGSPQARQAFEAIDAHVAAILRALDEAGIRQQTLVVVTGDHGFRHVHSSFQPNVALREAGLLKTGPDGAIVEWQAAAHRAAIKLHDPADSVLRARVEALFQGLVDGPYRGLLRVIGRPEIEALGGDTDAVLMLEPVDGYAFSDGFAGDAFLVASRSRGQHGYLPADPAMRTGFLASGPGIRSGLRLPSLRMIDIAPTLAQLLGVALPQAEGLAMPGLLETPPAR